MFSLFMDTNLYSSEFIVPRILLAFWSSLLMVVIFGGLAIKTLRKKQGKGQPIREDGPQSHLLTKKGTPTMGGIMIILSILLTCTVLTDWTDPTVLIALGVLIAYGFVGFIDDYKKVTKQTSNAMTAKIKLLAQFSFALISVLLITWIRPESGKFSTEIPFFGDGAYGLFVDISWFYIPFAMVVISGASNAVNLTDGLDGLAGGLLAIAFFTFGVIGLEKNYFEIGILCLSVAGACLGFLWYNAFPAKVFMGDTGSLALGALLGTVSVILRSELYLAIIGLIFVVEAISVMMQIFWYKRTGKRIFKMAPIHHHFEQLGIHENTIVMRFWMIGILLAFIGLGAR